jgi:hypothetical protein
MYAPPLLLPLPPPPADPAFVQLELSDAQNPFDSDKKRGQWSWAQIKRSSTGPGWEGAWYQTQPNLTCGAFPDVGFAFVADAGAGAGRTEWLTFRMLPHAAAALQGASTMRVLVCSGSRMGPWAAALGFRAQFGVQGKPVGPPANIARYLLAPQSLAERRRRRTGRPTD